MNRTKFRDLEMTRFSKYLRLLSNTRIPIFITLPQQKAVFMTQAKVFLLTWTDNQNALATV